MHLFITFHLYLLILNAKPIKPNHLRFIFVDTYIVISIFKIMDLDPIGDIASIDYKNGDFVKPNIFHHIGVYMAFDLFT